MKIGIVALSVFLALFMLNCEGDNKDVESVTVEDVKEDFAGDSLSTSVENAELTEDADTAKLTGIYKGELPCKDCESVETELKITSNNAYELVQKFNGKKLKVLNSKGTFVWDSTGTQLILDDSLGSKIQVMGDAIVYLNPQGKPINDELLEKYKLIKQSFSLENTKWRLVKYRGMEITDSLSKVTPTLFLNADDNSVSGTSSCNNFRGTYATDGTYKFNVSGVIATKKACLDANMETEFLAALNNVDNFILKGNRLLLNKGKMATILEFEAVEK